MKGLLIKNYMMFERGIMRSVLVKKTQKHTKSMYLLHMSILELLILILFQIKISKSPMMLSDSDTDIGYNNDFNRKVGMKM